MNILQSRGLNISIIPRQTGSPNILIDVFDREHGRVVSVLYTVDEAQQVADHLQKELNRARAPNVLMPTHTGH